ncbi:MAG: DHHA1 domain-containing protein [Patescibacteria group bacterium]
MKRPVVIYHADCPDGMSGGWAAWKKFGNRADYIAAHHQAPLPKNLKGRTIYIIDFSFPVPVMEKVVREAARVIAIDHHRMAEPSANLADEKHFALNRSGAVLAWHYFHPKKQVPLFLRYVEDVDLWKFSLPNTKVVSVLFELIPHEFKAWDRFVTNFEHPHIRKRLIEKGKAMREYEEALMRRILTRAVRVTWHRKTCYAVNSSIFASELGHELALMSSSRIGVVWHQFSQGLRVSLRSEGNVDVTRIARKYGGGGHRNAAGFLLKKGENLPWRVIA